jgi:hypothetical protein
MALMITAMMFWGFIGGFIAFSVSRPLVSTSYYHANIQFRAGNEASYEDIFRQSLQHIVNMYDAHPTWKWTLECQGLLIEMAYQNYTDVFEKIQRQNQRGQLELITPQYSHGLAVAYNYKDFAESIAYNKYLMEEVYNLTVSNVIVLQEGQFLPAFPLLKHLGFDTIAISRDQLSYHNYYPKQALLEYSYAGIDAYVMPLPWLPCFEAGVFHHQLALSDSERINTGDIEGPYEFNYNPEKMRQIELRHQELERMGNRFMTMAEWVIYCVEHGYTAKMEKFLPESHWTPQRHQSVSRWMAWGNGESDDGIVHARNYYTRNLIQTAEILLEQSNTTGLFSESELANCSEQLLTAKKYLWLAQVTDTSGVNPNALEFQYAINNTYIAQQLANEVIDFLRNRVAAWQTKIQVQAYERLVLTNSIGYTNLTIINNTQLKAAVENNYGNSISVKYSAEAICPSITNWIDATFSTILNGTLHEFEITIGRFTFTGPRGEFITNTQPVVGPINNSAACDGKRVEQHIIVTDNWERAHYTPSLADNYTQALVRSDYTPPGAAGNDKYIVPLPISNGLIYNDQKGYAIITNNTVRHISVKWESDYLDFYENDIKYNSQYELIFFKGPLEQAHLLATLINPYPTWTLEAIA